MNSSTFFFYTTALLLIAFFRLRAEKSRLRVVDIFLTYPAVVLLGLHTFLFVAWLTLGAAMLTTAIIVGVWWFAYGKNLPPSSSDNITVWGQDQKKPTIAEAQAEIEKLKQEKEELEKRLRELEKDKKNT